MKAFYILLTFFLFNVVTAYAQRVEPGIGIGSMNYTGDISSSYKFVHQRPAAELFIRYNVSPVVHLRVGGTIGRITASDKNSVDLFQNVRDITFEAEVYEGNARFEYNFIDFRKKSEVRSFSPFFFGGAGIAKVNNRSNFRSNTSKKLIPSVLFGVGCKFKMPYNFNWGFEFGARKAFSDDIDTLNDNDKLGKFQMSNPRRKDMYYYSGISLTYTFRAVYCPVVFQ